MKEALMRVSVSSRGLNSMMAKTVIGKLQDSHILLTENEGCEGMQGASVLVL